MWPGTKKLRGGLIGCLLMQSAQAAQLYGGRVTRNAHDSLGLTLSTLSDPGYRTGHSYQFGIADHGTGRADNTLGLQLDWHSARNVAVIVQSLTRRNGADKVPPSFPGAYVRWQPDSPWAVRPRRQRPPYFTLARLQTISARHEDRLTGWAGRVANVFLATQPCDRTTLSLDTRRGVRDRGLKIGYLPADEVRECKACACC